MSQDGPQEVTKLVKFRGSITDYESVPGTKDLGEGTAKSSLPRHTVLSSLAGVDC